jgi:diguanylate cyclase (GGDEF)-like protein/PAS domain S-box-containing protein
LEHVRDAVLLVRGSDGRIVTVNQAAEKTYGRSSDELLGLSIWDLLHPSVVDPANPRDTTRAGEIDEHGVLFRSIHLHADGRGIPVEVNARLAGMDGDTMIVAVVRDVSDRIRIERELAAAYEEIDQIFETAADGMRIVDRDFLVLRVNETFVRMAGVGRDEAVGAKCYETFGGPQCETDECPLRRILAGERSCTYEALKRTRDGTAIPCMVAARPFVREGEIVGIIEDFRDITERKQAEEHAQHLATHDALTGLPNRLLFSDRLEVALAQAARGDACPAVLFCDVDNLKTVNDTLGHRVGDEVLVAIAQNLTGVVRKADTVARLGGDEFVVLLPTAHGVDDALSVACKLLEAVRADGGAGRGATLSVGVAVFREGDGSASLLMRADEAMYEAKQQGGNALVVSA